MPLCDDSDEELDKDAIDLTADYEIDDDEATIEMMPVDEHEAVAASMLPQCECLRQSTLDLAFCNHTHKKQKTFR